MAAFVKAAILLDERSFVFQARLLIACIVVRLNPIRDLAPIANDLSNHIAFEGIGFADWVMPTGLGLVFQCPPIESFSNIEWSPVWAAQYIDVVPPGNRVQIAVCSATVSFKFHLPSIQFVWAITSIRHANQQARLCDPIMRSDLPSAIMAKV